VGRAPRDLVRRHRPRPGPRGRAAPRRAHPPARRGTRGRGHDLHPHPPRARRCAHRWGRRRRRDHGRHDRRRRRPHGAGPAARGRRPPRSRLRDRHAVLGCPWR
jgi:hypothetical protein